jgi:nucleotidyltransferase substrate binding protein (TIGR01987 family)
MKTSHVSNFEKAVLQLEKAVAAPPKNDLERDGVIQRFEFCYELAWKSLSDVIAAEGGEAASPRATFRTAGEMKLIANVELWMQLTNDRNIITHTYDLDTSKKLIDVIFKTYAPLLRGLSAMLSDYVKKNSLKNS